jgi:hypothetical protein
VGKTEGLSQLWKAVQQCLQLCDRPLHDVAAVCVGLAGLDHQLEAAAELAEALRPELAPGTEISVYDDAVITLSNGTGGHLHGCVVIAGEAAGIAPPHGPPPILLGRRHARAARAPGHAGIPLRCRLRSACAARRTRAGSS